MLTVKSFGINSAELADFQNFAIKLYHIDLFWQKDDELPPSEYLPRFFLAWRDGEVVGRAVAMINRGIAYQGRRTGLIGFYEAIDDLHVAQLLFENVFAYLRDQTCNYIIGPINGSTWNHYRITEPRNNKPFLLDNYHKDWYYKHFLVAGFATIAKYSSRKVTELAGPYPRLLKYEALFRNKGILIRSINLADFETELAKIYTISINSFKSNFLYTPLNWADFVRMYQQVRSLVDPKFVLIAEREAGEPLGFIFSLPNAYEPLQRSLVIKTVAVVSQTEAKGLGTLMAEKIHKLASENGYQEVIHALMHERNQSNNILAQNSQSYQRYVLLGRKL